ncbi:MAG: alpha/beta hydrolase [Clostridia bacterium]|nr:alpha/beta hydrolase [Clostridia bacterium]
MSKYTRFSRSVFKFCDVICQPLSNWWRQNTKGLTVEYDIAYGPEKCHTADIYFKTDLLDTKKPVFMNIHGGGFVGGDKRVRNALSVWYANMGYLVYNINYGLAPEYMFPQGPLDCINALNWLVDNKEKFIIDLDKLVIGGDSSGGYMATAVATTSYSKYLQDFYGVVPKVKPYATVLNCGIYDVETALKSKTIFNMASKIAVDYCGITTDKINEYEHRQYLSTIDYVTKDFPKAFIAYAKKDMFVQGQGERLIERLNNLGVYEEHYAAHRLGDNHVFPLFWDGISAKECNALIREFLIKVRDGII